MNRRVRVLVAVAVLMAAAVIGAQQPTISTNDVPEYGPATGTLVSVGGGNLNGSGISEKFIELAGGPEKKFVIVPTAGGNRNRQGEVIAYDEQRVIAPWLTLGLKNVRMLHTPDPKAPDTEAFARVLAVHDNTRLYQPWEKPYFVLSAGDVFNRKMRKVEKYGTAARGRGGDPGVH